MIVTQKAGETRYLLSDGLGSVRQAMDDNGSVVVYNEFDPYGDPIVNRQSSIVNPYGYTGEWWQEEVELLHLRARWYMPGTGTFLSHDAWEGDELQPQSFNGWNYVEENPVNRIDPSGFCSQPPPQVGSSDCEKFVTQVQAFIAFAQSKGVTDAQLVIYLTAYYTGMRVTVPFLGVEGWREIPIPPGYFARGQEHELWSMGDDREASLRSLDPLDPRFRPPLYPHKIPKNEAIADALNYGFKRMFYNNTHHYFADFYLAWFWGGPAAREINNRWERGQIEQNPDVYIDSASDILVAEVAIDHVRQTQGWFSNDLTLLPSLLIKDLCGSTMDEIYEEWSWPNPIIETAIGQPTM